MTWSELTGLVFDHAGDVAWSMVKGALLWGLLGVVVAVIAYLLARRAGALVLAGARWPAPAFVLTLAFVTVPMFVAAGVVTGMRDAATRLIDTQLAPAASTQVVGDVLILPVVAEGPAGDDLRWLADPAARRAALDRVTDDALASALARVTDVDSDVIAWARAQALRFVVRHRARYDALLVRIVVDADGGLTRASAARQVGRAFLDQEVRAPVAETFDGTRLWMLLGALAAPLLLVLAVRLLARRA